MCVLTLHMLPAVSINANLYVDRSIKFYRFSNSTSANVCVDFFQIEPTTSVIRTKGVLDREAIVKRQMQSATPDSVLCIVQYTDVSLNAPKSRFITIDVLDINDEVPHLLDLSQPHMEEIQENFKGAFLHLQPIDYDKGENGTIDMSIVSGNTSVFEINDFSFLATLLRLDFESDPHTYNVVIRLTDGGNPSNSFDQEITVVLLNLIDSPPMIAEDSLEFSVPEDHPVGPSHPFASINVTNADDVQGIEYSILALDPSPLENIAVNASNGNLYFNGPLDLEDSSNPTSYRFNVQVRNSVGSDTVLVTVMVEDLNDNAPFLTCQGGTLPCPTPQGSPFDGQQNITFSSNDATHVVFLEGNDDDHSVVNSAIEFSNTPLPPGITLQEFPVNENLRILNINSALLSTCHSTFTITVRNTAPPMLSSSATVNINKCGA